MNFTDIFIRRPVLASVVSLAILVLGPALVQLRCRCSPTRRPKTASSPSRRRIPVPIPNPIAGFITTPIETAVAQANGIDYMTSVSQSSVSTITVNLRQNYDTAKAASEINIKVNSILNQLPLGALQPTITVKVGQTTDAMYIGFRSQSLASNQITDYLTRVVVPQLQAVAGVQTAEIIGGQTFSLRAWLDPKKLASYGHDGDRRLCRPRQQRLHFRGRQHQGRNGAGDADLDQQSALPERIPGPDRQADQRQQHPPERCRRGDPGRGQLRSQSALSTARTACSSASRSRPRRIF